MLATTLWQVLQLVLPVRQANSTLMLVSNLFRHAHNVSLVISVEKEQPTALPVRKAKLLFLKSRVRKVTVNHALLDSMARLTGAV